ncbi:MAG: sulfotransferase domain-containing protein [Acidisphaera sp.]|nr:sulfotransferase domain-containing protein [Acidisphaera sp.]
MGKLVWLASYPKSGNTWLRAFLHNYLRRTTAPHDINRLHELTLAESDVAHFARHAPQDSLDIATVQRLRPSVHREFTTASPTLVFVKTHNASLVVAGVSLVTPEVTAGAIYLVRDPRDVAVSYARHLGLAIEDVIALMADPEAAIGGDGRNVYERLSSWSVHVHFWTRRPDPSLHVMRYEDVLVDPHGAFGDVVRFLGGEPRPHDLARAVSFSAFGSLQAQEREFGFAERPPGMAAFFREGRSGGWRSVLTRGQAARIERTHGREMARFGYA